MLVGPDITKDSALSSEPSRDSASETLPSYSSSPTNSPTSPGLPSLPRTNFLAIQRRNSPIKGTYVIDPLLNVPEAVLAPLEPGEERKNLLLECQNGSIDVEVHLVGTGMEDFSQETEKRDSRKRPTTIVATGHNGFVALKMSADKEHPFSIYISTKNGGISLALPRGFSGPLMIRSKNSRVSFSPALDPNIAHISDVEDTHRCFVGDFASSNYGQGEWLGSSVDIDCHNGRVKVCYVDELDEQEAKSGFLSKFFGFRF